MQHTIKTCSQLTHYILTTFVVKDHMLAFTDQEMQELIIKRKTLPISSKTNHMQMKL